MKFQEGNSLGGRPKKSNRLAGMCREHTEHAVQVLIEGLEDEKIENRLKAVSEILNRGWGKPPESITVAGDEENPLRHKVVIELIRPGEKLKDPPIEINVDPDTGGV